MFIIALIFLVLALIAFGLSRLFKNEELDEGAYVASMSAFFVFLAFAVGLTVGASISAVPTKNVGIVTEFGKPTGRTTGAGLKFTAPWQDIDDWDASRNTYNRLGGNCLWVSISGGRACISVQIEWSAKAENAPKDWASYKAIKDVDGGRFGAFTARRVNPQMDAAITKTFTSFNPLGLFDEKTGALQAPDLNTSYKAILAANLAANIGSSVTIDSIAFGTPSYDEPTTKQISQYGQKVLEARNLAVDKTNAETRKAITDIDAKADPVARCLSIAEKMNKEPGLCMTPATAVRSVK